jgi:hypothetical protein
MTIAIGAKYPCGRLSVLQTHLPQAIIFVTDSRWTYSSPQVRFEDIGTKLFYLSNNSAIVYAGDVASAEHCISELKRKLQNSRLRIINVSETFQRVYKHHLKNRSSLKHPLFFLMGVYLKTGQANLIYFESPAFKPVFLKGVQGIGEMVAVDEVKEIAYQHMDELIEGNVKDHAMKLGMWLAGIVHEQAILNPKYSTVAGPIQFAIVDKDGIQASELSWTKDPTGAKDTWHRATARSGELTTFQKRHKLSPNFINIKAFGLHTIVD